MAQQLLDPLSNARMLAMTQSRLVLAEHTDGGQSDIHLGSPPEADDQIR